MTLDWMDGEGVRPYVLVRTPHTLRKPSELFDHDWFPFEPLTIDPLKLSSKPFTDAILRLENLAFASADLAMPRWVFYDCAVLPGITTGFAIHRDRAPQALKQILFASDEMEYIPLSLFIAIPSIHSQEWVAHNLCTINSLLPVEGRFHGLGFLSKAFGLWFANIEKLIGVTQWDNPALKLHVYFGPCQVLTAYSPIHTHPASLTYRVQVEPEFWTSFLTRQDVFSFSRRYVSAERLLNVRDPAALAQFQTEIDAGSKPYFLNPHTFRSASIPKEVPLFHMRP